MEGPKAPSASDDPRDGGIETYDEKKRRTIDALNDLDDDDTHIDDEVKNSPEVQGAALARLARLLDRGDVDGALHIESEVIVDRSVLSTPEIKGKVLKVFQEEFDNHDANKMAVLLNAFEVEYTDDDVYAFIAGKIERKGSEAGTGDELLGYVTEIVGSFDSPIIDAAIRKVAEQVKSFSKDEAEKLESLIDG